GQFPICGAPQYQRYAMTETSNKPKTTILNASLIVASIVVAFVLLEAGFYIRVGFSWPGPDDGIYKYENFYVSSKPIAVFDRVSGYKRFPYTVRIVRIIHDQLIFDQTFTPNNAGYISDRDYSYPKPSPDTIRIAVFGDSFT